MPFRCTIMTFALLIVLPVVRTQAQNAADLYRQAFEQLPAELSDAEQNALDHAGTFAPDEAALKLVQQHHAALNQIRQAAKVSNCDWKIDYAQGPLVKLPHLHAARTGAGIMLLRAADHLENNRHTEGIEDVLAVMSLGRRVGAEPVIVCRLVDISIEQRAGSCLARYLPSLPPDLVGRLEAQIDALPSATPIADTVLRETKVMSDWIRNTETLPEELHPDVQGDLADAWRDEATRKQGADQLQAIIAQAVKTLSIPEEDFHAAMAAFEEEVMGAGPVAKTFVPNFTYLRTHGREYDARRAMLRAAITIVRDGPDALPRTTDPAGEGPFTYEQRDGEGFLLISAAQNRDGPVTLTVGK